MAVSAARVAGRRIANIVFVAFCWLVTAIALIALVAILWTLVSRGAGAISLDTFTKTTPAHDTRGGLADAITGSIILCAIGMAIALLVGVLAGTWLSEYAGKSRYGAVVRFLNDVLLSAPSILIGLFVYQVLVAHLIGHFSGIAGGIALAMIAVPVITRTTEDVLRIQPTTLRESGIAVGAPYWHVVRTILWRAASGGILTGALLAFARISGETAPLMFTAFGNNEVRWDITHPLAALPLAIYQLSNTAFDDLINLAWAGALIIAASVLIVTIIARALSREQKRS